MDTCAGSTDSFALAATIGLDTNLDNLLDVTLFLSGDTSILRGDPIDTQDPLDPGHPNKIEVEMVALTLTGGGVTLAGGDGVGNLMNDGPLGWLEVVIVQPKEET